MTRKTHTQNRPREIDFNDLQGLIRFSHGQLSEACYLVLHVNDPVAARTWLSQAPVTTALKLESLPEQALQLAFTAEGLSALEVDEAVISGFSDEFIGGMVDKNRSRRLGDIANNSPEHWLWGSSTNPESQIPHLVIMLYAGTGKLKRWRDQLKNSDFDAAFHIQTELTTAQLSDREPFGFVDGISQPEIDWQGKVETDPHLRDSYTNLLALGEMVLGYTNEYGLYTQRPLIEPANNDAARALPNAEEQPTLKDLGRNGTYVVMRQLGQDVPGFWQFMDQQANANAEQREQLAAAMVGRRRDGTPLVSAPKHISDNDTDKASGPNNRFTFDDDPRGLQCPVGAHIRRSNPRTGDVPPGVHGTISRLIRTLGFGRRHAHDDLIASARFHRIVRRGRAYGPTLSPDDAIKTDISNTDELQAERGLQFICLGANISRQFEFIQNAWAMSPKFAGLPTESDPLLGNREPLLNGEGTDGFTLPQADAPAHCVKGLPQFVTVRGGAYFFMPGIKALQYITQQSTRTAARSTSTSTSTSTSET